MRAGYRAPARRPLVSQPARRGSLIPALALAILAVGGCLALVLDHIWLATAHREIQAAANAAALAGARELADDATLLADFDSATRAAQIRSVAAQAGMANLAAGQKVFIDSAEDSDVRLGRSVMDPNTGWETFLETDDFPTSVVVTARCESEQGNPIHFFFPAFIGQTAADVVARAEASISNHVAGFAPWAAGTAPVWPLGILEHASDPESEWGWIEAIENREGNDHFSWDEAAGVIVARPDGLPEITLRPAGEDHTGNTCLLDLGSGLLDEPLRRQLEEGLIQGDLDAWGGELSLASGGVPLIGTSDFSGFPGDVLRHQLGAVRMVLLYEPQGSASGTGSQSVTATRLAAARIMDVHSGDAGLQIVVQAAVISTRTALLDETSSPGTVVANPYVYKMSLTR